MNLNGCYQQISSIWAYILRQNLEAKKNTIVEVGPGFTSKIGVALAELSFDGELYIIEPNVEASNWVSTQYQALLPNADIYIINSDVIDTQDELPLEIDAVLMNHVLDDMILNEALSTSQSQQVFGHMKAGYPVIPEVHSTWEELILNTDKLNELRGKVVSDICSFLANTNTKLFATSQYPSWYHANHELDHANEQGLELLHELKLQLDNTTEKFNDILQIHNQNPSHWLVMERADQGQTLISNTNYLNFPQQL